MTKTHQNIDSELEMLDSLTSESHPGRDATHFRRIVAALRAQQDADAELRAAVAAARAAGDSWTVIAAALGTSRQNAQQRFANLV